MKRRSAGQVGEDQPLGHRGDSTANRYPTPAHCLDQIRFQLASRSEAIWTSSVLDGPTNSRPKPARRNWSRGVHTAPASSAK